MMKATGGIVSVFEHKGPPTEDEIVATMACAMAKVDGHDPSDWGPLVTQPTDPEPVYWSIMKDYVLQAQKLRVAYKTMRQMEPYRQ